MNKGACELKSAQFSLMRLAIYQTDANAIQSFVADQVSAAPELLDGAPVALDFCACGKAVDFEFVEDIVSRLGYAGMQPIAIVAELDSAQAGIARSLRLGVLAPLKRSGRVKSEIESRDERNARNGPSSKSMPESTAASIAPLRAAKNAPVDTSPVDTTPVDTTPVDTTPVETAAHVFAPFQKAISVESTNNSPRENIAQPHVARSSTRVESPAPATPSVQRYEGQVRSGQQLYAKGRDLIVTGAAGASSEVIADGSIHIYGRLMGKVIAGASGDRNARIYCLAFGAELVSIAGIFRVFESIPADLMGKSVQIWLDGDKLRFDTLI